jgi:group II intron reverse transcriptase/maturase
MINGYGKSDNRIVPEKPLNKARAAEGVEGRRLAEGKPLKFNTYRTQGRESVSRGLERIRQAADRDRRQRFTALFHHVYDVDQLRLAYAALKREAAPGIDGETWRQYGEGLEERLEALSHRLQRGAYRVNPVLRAYIPKRGGGQRPIGIPTLEDKIVQRAVAGVMGVIYELDFLGFSYGFRPKRNAHQAVDALSVGIVTKKVNWVLDADIRGYFDTLDHEWLVKFIEHRIGDRRIVRLVQKWLKAGVLEEGKQIQSEVGTVQGGSISPLLANIYLHYVLDLWIERWRKKQAQGDVIVVRWADDFIVGFEHRWEGERFLIELRERFSKFGLELHPDKTRLIEFGRYARSNRARRGEGKPETFDFLGFTHICSETKEGRFTVLRKTMQKRLQAKLKEVHSQLRRRMHQPVPEQGKYLRSVILGHMRYYGVPRNRPSIAVFRKGVCWLWRKVLKCRSQKHRLNWDRMKRLISRWLPTVYVCHPHPLVRFGVIT